MTKTGAEVYARQAFSLETFRPPDAQPQPISPPLPAAGPALTSRTPRRRLDCWLLEISTMTANARRRANDDGAPSPSSAAASAGLLQDPPPLSSMNSTPMGPGYLRKQRDRGHSLFFLTPLTPNFPPPRWVRSANPRAQPLRVGFSSPPVLRLAPLTADQARLMLTIGTALRLVFGPSTYMSLLSTRATALLRHLSLQRYRSPLIWATPVSRHPHPGDRAVTSPRPPAHVCQVTLDLGDTGVASSSIRATAISLSVDLSHLAPASMPSPWVRSAKMYFSAFWLRSAKIVVGLFRLDPPIPTLAFGSAIPSNKDLNKSGNFAVGT